MTENFPEWIVAVPGLLIGLALWSVVWKGVALWQSARRSQRGWFIALLVINTAGILEIIYIFLISKKTQEQLNVAQQPRVSV